jgi:hypothetical protein
MMEEHMHRRRVPISEEFVDWVNESRGFISRSLGHFEMFRSGVESKSQDGCERCKSKRARLLLGTFTLITKVIACPRPQHPPVSLSLQTPSLVVNRPFARAPHLGLQSCAVAPRLEPILGPSPEHGPAAAPTSGFLMPPRRFRELLSCCDQRSKYIVCPRC